MPIDSRVENSRQLSTILNFSFAIHMLLRGACDPLDAQNIEAGARAILECIPAVS